MSEVLENPIAFRSPAEQLSVSLVTYEEAAARLGISVRSLERLVAAGEIKACRPLARLGSGKGKGVRFQPVVLDKYLARFAQR